MSQETGMSTPPSSSALPWERRRENGVNKTFFATVRLLMRINGRLESYLDAPVEVRSARSFRSLVMSYAVMTASMLFLVGGCLYLSDKIEHANHPVADILATLGVVAALVVWLWLMIRLYLGVAKWFFVSHQLSPQQQNNAISLVQYLIAALALLPLVVLPAPLILASLQMAKASIITAGILLICVWVYWFQMILFAMHSLTGLGWGRVIARGLGLLAVWAVLAAGAVLVPLSVPMWLLMRASLQ